MTCVYYAGQVSFLAAIFPGLTIFVSPISVNYVGDGLKDALGPHKVFKKTQGG